MKKSKQGEDLWAIIDLFRHQMRDLIEMLKRLEERVKRIEESK